MQCKIILNDSTTAPFLVNRNTEWIPDQDQEMLKIKVQ